MNDLAKRFVGTMLEDGQPPEMPTEPSPEGAPAAKPDRGQHWDNAHKSFGELWDLTLKKQETMRELGGAIAYERALYRAGITRADVKQAIRADAVYETTPIPPGHPLKGIRVRYSRKHPKAIVGVLTNEDKSVFFAEPVAARWGDPTPTYEEFMAKENAAREHRRNEGY